jgi:hypothetical protein
MDNKAKIVTLELSIEWNDSNGEFYHDGYFDSIEELIEYLQDLQKRGLE